MRFAAGVFRVLVAHPCRSQLPVPLGLNLPTPEIRATRKLASATTSGLRFGDNFLFADDTEVDRGNHLKTLVFIEDLQDYARLQLLADWNLAAQFVGEVH
jgi:hypothetical protein